MAIDRELISESMYRRKVVEVPLGLISNINVNPRKHGTIKENVDKLVAAEEFPEIHLGLYDGDLIVVDGYHRVEASQILGREAINAFITEYEDMLELKKQAFLSNVNHGIMLSEYDTAINMYEFYIQGKVKKPNLKIREMILEHGVPERKGRALLIWAVINKEVLGSTIEEIKDLAKCEEFFKLVTARSEKIGSISETFKEEFKRFYIKYAGLPQVELRVAVNMHLEDKDYFQEKAREAEMKKAEEESLRSYDETVEDISEAPSFEKIDKEDLVDRNANADYSEREVAKGIVASAEEQTKETVAEFESKKEEESKKMRSITNTLTDVTEKLMGIDFMVCREQVDVTEDNLTMLKDLKERLELLIGTVEEQITERKGTEAI